MAKNSITTLQLFIAVGSEFGSFSLSLGSLRNDDDDDDDDGNDNPTNQLFDWLNEEK